MSRHLALVTSKREATLKPRAEGIAWRSKLVHHAGRGENSILVLLCLDEAQNVLKIS